MIIQVRGFSVLGPSDIVSVRCPACKRQGTFNSFGSVNDIAIGNQAPPIIMGQRMCPNPECQAHLFFVCKGGKVLISYPPELIDFDPVNLPPPWSRHFKRRLAATRTGVSLLVQL